MFGDSNDQSGTVGFLVGIIVLVFVGIVFSLMVDKRFRFSSGRISIGESLAEEAHVLAAARKRLERAEAKWQKESHPRSGQESELASLKRRAEASGELLKSLRERRAAVEVELDLAGAAFGEYRDRYRKQVRADAAGEKLAELGARGGKVYTNVEIRKVTDVGIEIVHSQGISRLRSRDLDGSWHERFQWDEGEVEQALGQERAREDQHRDSVEKAANRSEPVTKPSKEMRAAEEADKNLAALRREVIEARGQMNKAESEAVRARQEAGANRGRSVPGSLETWEAKARRLDGLSTKLRQKYVAARSRLAAVSPTDSLLQDASP